MLKINNCSRNNFLYPPNRANPCFGANQNTKTSEKKEKLAIVALFAGVAFATALGVSEAVKTHKTFKDYRKSLSFMDWNYVAMAASGLVLVASMLPDVLNKKEKIPPQKEDSSFLLKVGGSALGILAVTMAVSWLDMAMCFDGIFKKKIRKP